MTVDTPTIIALAAICGLFLNVGVQIYSGGWNLAGKLADMEKRLSQSIVEAKEEIESRQESSTKHFGETIAALRQKINDVELYGANHYLRREDMQSVKQELGTDLRDLGKELKAWLARLEQKIDTKT